MDKERLVTELTRLLTPSENKESLLKELTRLLECGVPLLTAFQKQSPESYPLQLPDNISEAMLEYANEVALRAHWGREDYQHHWYRDETDQRYWYRNDSDPYLRTLIATFGDGLLGWRALGVL